MKSVTLRGVTRHDPDALPAALQSWLGTGVAVSTLREGDDMVVTLTGPQPLLDASADQVVRFYLCWRRAAQPHLRISRVGERRPEPRSFTRLGEDDGDPAAASFVPSGEG